MGRRLGGPKARKYGKPGGHGGQCKMSVIIRVHTIIFTSRWPEGRESLKEENLERLEASAKRN